MAELVVYIRKLHAFAGIKLYMYLMGMIISSMLEGIGIFLLAPMLSLIGLVDSINHTIPFATLLAKPLSLLPEEIRLPAVLGLFLVLFFGQAIVQRAMSNLNREFEQGFIRHLRLQVYKSLLQANWPFFMKKRKSDFTHIMTQELPRVNYGIFTSLQLTVTMLFTAVQIGFALWISVKLTLLVMVCGMLLALYSRRFIKRSQTVGDELSTLMQTYIAGMTEHFNGIKDIKSNMTEAQYVRWFHGLCSQMERNVVQFTRLQSNSQFNYKIASGILIALFALCSFEFFHVQAARLLLVIIIFSRLWPKFSGVQSRWENLAQSLPAFKSLLELQKECEGAQEFPLNHTPNNENPVRISQGIECRNVSYRYELQNSTYALQDINLNIVANSVTAIVGKSGAGKSTLVDLLIGLLQPEKGKVLVDGKTLVDESTLLLRKSVSYVSQEPFLFHTSLRENLRIGAPHATEEQMWEALSFSAADAFVRELPQGLDTVLGDRGIRLSGGERQRIVLARAILRKPSILILDEATSALDSENEAKIQQALERVRGSMTIIVIAHRLSTVRNADQVIVLDKGKIIQNGNFDQLSKISDGMFSQLLEYQVGITTG